MDQITNSSTAQQSYIDPIVVTSNAFVDPNTKPEVFTVDHLTQGAYNQCLIDTRYLTTTGLDVLACGQSDDNAENVVIRVSNGVTEKMVFWTEERINAMPLIPALTTKDPNEIAISQELLFANVFQLLNGSQLWRASGVNKYKLLKAKNANSIYPIGSTPAEVATAQSRFYGPSNFSTAIIDASAGAETAPTLNLQTAIPKVGT